MTDEICGFEAFPIQIAEEMAHQLWREVWDWHLAETAGSLRKGWEINVKKRLRRKVVKPARGTRQRSGKSEHRRETYLVERVVFRFCWSLVGYLRWVPGHLYI